MLDESAFTPMFLESCTDMELVVLQHDLRRFPEDQKHLADVLNELKRRATPAARKSDHIGHVRAV